MNYEVNVLLFGILRKYSKESAIKLEVPHGTPLSEFRKILARVLSHKNGEPLEESLLDDCAFGDESEILGSEFVIDRKLEIAILPPVCGG